MHSFFLLHCMILEINQIWSVKVFSLEFCNKLTHLLYIKKAVFSWFSTALKRKAVLRCNSNCSWYLKVCRLDLFRPLKTKRELLLDMKYIAVFICFLFNEAQKSLLSLLYLYCTRNYCSGGFCWFYWGYGTKYILLINKCFPLMGHVPSCVS